MILNIKEAKEKYFHVSSDNADLEKTHLWQVFLRIFTLLFSSFFPIVLASFFLFLNNNYNEVLKMASIEAVGYTINIVFIIVYYVILYIGIISSKLKHMINNCHSKRETNITINSGKFVLFTIAIILLTIFIVLSLVYSYVRANTLQWVSEYIISYMLIMIPIILCNMIANFYINLLFSLRGIKSNLLMLSIYFLTAIEIMLIYFFCFYINTNNIPLMIMLPSLIINLLKLCVFGFIFYSKINHLQEMNQTNDFGKYRYFSFSFDIYKKIIKRCQLSIYFSFSLMFTIIIQSMLIRFMSTIDPSLSYLHTENDYYILLFVKIVVYNILYLLFLFSRSLNISMLEKEIHSNKKFKFRMVRRMNLRKINTTLITITIVFAFCIYFALNQIIDNLFSNLSWYNEINKNGLFANESYNVIIPQLIKQAYLFGIIAFFLVEQSINNRVIIFRTDETNKILFTIIIISYAISTSILTYVFAFQLNYIFIGLSGFLISFGIYGLISLIFLYFFDLFRSRKKYVIFTNANKIPSLIQYSILKWKRNFVFRQSWKFDLVCYSINYISVIVIFSLIIHQFYLIGS